jgi:hypothetical protein
VENGICFEVIWFDLDMIEVVVGCSNGHFSGRAEVYLNHCDLPQLADSLRGFPTSGSDLRSVELGTFDPSHADGGVIMGFSCLDSRGHAVVEVKLRGDACRALGEPESVALRIPIEPAGLDSFLLQLMAIDNTIGGRAFLPMAT